MRCKKNQCISASRNHQPCSTRAWQGRNGIPTTARGIRGCAQVHYWHHQWLLEGRPHAPARPQDHQEQTQAHAAGHVRTVYLIPYAHLLLCFILLWFLTHWGRDKMDAISQTTISSAFSWIKISKFRLKFHWSLFLRVQLTIFQHWFRYWLGAVQATSHYLNQWWLIYRRIYTSLGLNELMDSQLWIYQHPPDCFTDYDRPMMRLPQFNRIMGRL